MKKVLLIIIAVLFVVVYFANKYNESIDKEMGVENVKKDTELNAKLLYDGTQFTIKNNDNFDYENVKLTINNDYELSAGTIRAGETKYYQSFDFSNSKSDRFTYLQKYKELLLSCTVYGEIVIAKWQKP